MGDEESVTVFNGGDGSNAGKWASRVSDELNELPRILSVESKRWEKQSIYRIPHSIKELYRSAYEPQTVSIGPYHHGEPHLEAMEEHKHRALLTFLHRSKKPLQWYMDALAPVAEDLKNAYQGLDPKWEQDSEAFLQLMIVDGCFVLEIMRSTTATLEELSRMGYKHNDPLFSSHGTLSFSAYVQRDMLKLENQLPLLLLVELLLAEDGSLAVDELSKQGELISLILEYIRPWKEKNIENYVASLHILDVYRKSLVSSLPLKKKKFRKKRPKAGEYHVLSAMNLSESGVSFKPSKTKNINDISFRRGVLKLPRVIVDDMFESNYRNMMAFEKFHFGAGHQVAYHVYFMSTIINNARDASLLMSCGVLFSGLGNDQAVADLFTSLSRDVCLYSDSELAYEMIKMLDYCRSPLPSWMAYAKRNYFTNVWVGISFFAAIFLFALAGIQTVYTVIAYYDSKTRR